MGNLNSLSTPSIYKDQDFADFQFTHQPFNKQVIQIEPTENPHIQVQSSAKILISNYVFCEIEFNIQLQNTSQVPVIAKIPIHFIHQNKLVLTNIQITHEQQKEQRGKFISLLNLMNNSQNEQKFVNISDQQSTLDIEVKGSSTSLLIMNYLQGFKIFQKSLLLLQMHITSICEINVLLEITSNLIISPTHQLVQLSKNGYQAKGFSKKQFDLIIQAPPETKMKLFKFPLGDKQYIPEQKYCAMISMTPEIANQDDIDIFLDFNVAEELQAKEYFNIVSSNKFPTQIIIYVDQSNSMQGNRQKEVQRVLPLFIKNLPPGSYYNVYFYGSTFKKIFPQPVEQTQTNLTYTLEQFETMQANMGSTFLLKALEDSISNGLKDQTWFIITDGLIAESDTIVELLRKEKDVRVYTFGLGEEYDHMIVQQLGEEGRGKYYDCEQHQRMFPSILNAIQHITQFFYHKFSFDDFDSSQITMVYPNPQNLIVSGNEQTIIFFVYFSNIILEKNPQIRFRSKFSRENSEELQVIDSNLNFKNAEKGGFIHLFGFNQILRQAIIKLNWVNQFEFLKYTHNSISIGQLTKLSEKYTFLNPLMSIQFENCFILESINIENLLKISSKRFNKKSLLQTFNNVLGYQDNLKLQQQLQKGFKEPRQMIQQQFDLVEILDTGKNMIDIIIMKQNFDGSFRLSDIECFQICMTQHKTIIPLNKKEIGIVEGKVDLPNYIAEKVVATVTVLGYLKRHYFQNRDQWFYIHLRGINFLAKSVKNYRQILHKGYQMYGCQ